MTETMGKMIGMFMAYAISSLGLLLAYYNYRKRIVKAEKIFTRNAKIVLFSVIGVAFAGLVLGAAALSPSPESWWTKIYHQLPGILVPVLVFAVSFWVTWALFQHFMKQMKSAPEDSQK